MSQTKNAQFSLKLWHYIRFDKFIECLMALNVLNATLGVPFYTIYTPWWKAKKHGAAWAPGGYGN